MPNYTHDESARIAPPSPSWLATYASVAPCHEAYPATLKVGQSQLPQVGQTKLPKSDVHHRSRHLIGRGMRREQIGLDDVLDVGEIAALLAIAEHRRHLAAQRESATAD